MRNGKIVFLRSAFLPALLCVMAVSCASQEPSDRTLLLYVRAQDIYREGRFAEAARMLAGETEFVPALVLRGKAAFLSGDSASAERSLKRALKLKPEDTEASLFLARVLREKGKPAEAQKLAEKILGSDPLDIRTLRFAAELARERGVSGEAASAALLDRAVEASAESALVFLDRARQRWIGGNGTGALEDLARARVLLPSESPLMKAVEKLESVVREVSL